MLVGRSEKKLKRKEKKKEKEKEKEKEKKKEKREKKKRERREVSEDLPANSTTIFECQKLKVREGGEKQRFVHKFLMPEAQPHQAADLLFSSRFIYHKGGIWFLLLNFYFELIYVHTIFAKSFGPFG